ncbi:MAG: hypothetical protein GX568_01915 [Candidatus Gastranaerophilales bacterium]|nr:hypothetical protein [Candidatus Gastranaerophilales bacterium]
MSIFEQLQKNKGTTSSALGKELANEVLRGNNDILMEAIQLVSYDAGKEKSKNVRASAAKIIEKVAEEKPEKVSPYLDIIFPALAVKEPQTRWMIMMTFGYCAKLNQEKTVEAIPFAKTFIKEHQGLCLSGAAERYLGQIGEISPRNAEIVFPILLEAFDDPLPNEMDWILEAFCLVFHNLSPKNKGIVVECANEYVDSSKPCTKKRAEKILKLSKKS